MQVSAPICFSDSIHDVLIVGGGSYFYTDSLHAYRPLYRYNGFQWDTLGLFGNVIFTAVVWHDTLIVGGAFKTIHDEPMVRIACYVNGTWQPYGAIDTAAYAGHVSNLRIIDGVLYALGVFEYADGQLCKGVAKRVGGHWEALGPMPEFEGDPYMFDIAKFQGQLVVSGNFNTIDGVLVDLMQFNGSTWEPVCNCMHGGFDSAGNLVVYNGDLYMGGACHYSSGNPGQGILRWDGGQWYGLRPPGDGIQTINNSDQYTPVIDMVKAHDGRLFFSGGFTYVDHMATPGIASWDGANFCTLGDSDLTYGVFSFAFYHDTLYASTGPDVTTGRGLVRYLSTDFTYECGSVGIDDGPTVDQPLRAEWAPNGVLTLWGLKDGVHDLRVFDAQGRIVLDESIQSREGSTGDIPFPSPRAAFYMAVVDGQRVCRFIPFH